IIGAWVSGVKTHPAVGTTALTTAQARCTVAHRRLSLWASWEAGSLSGRTEGRWERRIIQELGTDARVFAIAAPCIVRVGRVPGIMRQCPPFQAPGHAVALGGHHALVMDRRNVS